MIGRHPSCDVVMTGDTVSRRHARLTFRDGGWIVQDLDSTNGTRLNGQLRRALPAASGRSAGARQPGPARRLTRGPGPHRDDDARVEGTSTRRRARSGSSGEAVTVIAEQSRAAARAGRSSTRRAARACQASARSTAPRRWSRRFARASTSIGRRSQSTRDRTLGARAVRRTPSPRSRTAAAR